MNLNNGKLGKRAAFTIIELLTVMSIIVILFGLLVPAMTLVKKGAKDVKQQAQFHAIEAGLQLFHTDFGDYPESVDANAAGVLQYPGGMKLAEAMAGRDMLGYNPASRLTAKVDMTTGLYPQISTTPSDSDKLNLQSRKGPYLQVERANINSLSDYTFASGASNLGDVTTINTTSTTTRQLVIGDEYPRVTSASTGKRIGMPVLYYKANVSGYMHDIANVASATTSGKNIYNSKDNQELIDLPLPWDPSQKHAMATGGTPGPGQFYTETANPKINPPTIDNTKGGGGGTTVTGYQRPCNPDTFILISAGYDGIYGTKDDILNIQTE